jgi:cobalt/nickel transport system permease protein
MLIPFAFLFTGVITIIISKLPDTGRALFYFPLFGSFYGVTPASLSVGVNLFLKSLGAVSCLYFFSLNTPMNSFLSLMRKRVPGIFVELMELIYRFIFIIWDESRRIYTAQNSRLGYRGFRNSMSSFGELVTTVFIRALRRVDRISVALESRGFDGNFDFLLEEERPNVLLKALTLLCSLAFITIGILERLH